MLSIEDQEHILALVEAMPHSGAYKKDQLRLKIASSIAQDKLEEAWVAGMCEEELTITLLRMRALEGGELSPQRVNCFLVVNRRSQAEVAIPISKSETIRDAIDAFRRRSDEAGATGNRVDAQSGWSW